jgi:hypothetical protein
VAPGPVGRTILGLAALTVTTREQVRKRAETKTQRQARRTESELWFETLQAIGKPPKGAVWISVGDRGSDIFSYFRQAADAGWHVLSRLCQDRLVEEIDAPGTPCSLLFVLRNRAPMANQTVEHPATGGRPVRLDLSVSWLPVRVQPPRNGPWRKAEPLACWLTRA